MTIHEQANVCPQCGGVLQLESCCLIDEPVLTPYGASRRRQRLASALLCTGCEYCVEVSELARPRTQRIA